VKSATETAASDHEWKTTARVAAVVIVAKAFLFLTIFLSLELLPVIFNGDNYLEKFHWPANETPNHSWLFKTWDSAHFLYLSEEGYADAEASAAFYPLWPIVIGFATPVFGSSLLSALILANLFSTVGLVLLHRLVARFSDERIADTTLLLALAYPGALYYCLPYSESLFLMITVGVFILVSRNRLGAAAGLAILAPAARAVGIFLVIPLGWWLFSDARKGRRPWWHCMLALAPILGLALTMGFIWTQTGNAFASFEAQANYASEGTISKIFAPMAFVRSFFDVWGVHGVLHSGIDRLLFVVMVAGLIPLFRREGGIGPLSLYSTVMIVFPAVTMSMMSFTRYPTMAFPVFFSLALVLADDRRKELRWFVISLFLILQFFFLIRHINAHWAG